MISTKLCCQKQYDVSSCTKIAFVFKLLKPNIKWVGIGFGKTPQKEPLGLGRVSTMPSQLF